MSPDIFKAYDMVNISYLQKVREVIKILTDFIPWVLMLHVGATTILLLDFIINLSILLFQSDRGIPLR